MQEFNFTADFRKTKNELTELSEKYNRLLEKSNQEKQLEREKYTSLLQDHLLLKSKLAATSNSSVKNVSDISRMSPTVRTYHEYWGTDKHFVEIDNAKKSLQVQFFLLINRLNEKKENKNIIHNSNSITELVPNYEEVC